jgi:hypothetical protein
MGTAVSLIVIAAGAILTFAVTRTATGIDLHAVGWILMIVGGIGLVLSIAMWERLLGPPQRREPERRYPDPDDAPTRRF